jgi:hypothetical protein
MLSYLSSQSIYCGDVIQFKTGDTSNIQHWSNPEIPAMKTTYQYYKFFEISSYHITKRLPWL